MTRAARPWLWPLVPAYRLALALREFQLRAGLKPVRRLRRPVVSVGNLSAGGAGKTPLVIALAKALTARGMPTGEDEAAYGYLLSPLSNATPEPCPAECTFTAGLAVEFLQKFPASTYAAYVVRDLTVSKGLAQVDPARLATLLGGGLRGVARSIPCPPAAGCDPNLRLNGQNRPEQAIDWTARWIDIVLKAHPDIWFADELRLRLALDEIAAGKSSLGASNLENLSRTAPPDIAASANRLLTLVKEKGLAK